MFSKISLTLARKLLFWKANIFFNGGDRLGKPFVAGHKERLEMEQNVIALNGKSSNKVLEPTGEPAASRMDAGPTQRVAAPVAPAGEVQAPAKGRGKGWIKRTLLAATAIIVVAGVGYFGHDYWTVGRFLVSTDDAYIKADNSSVAPKVSGYLKTVLVGDNQAVKAGQVVAMIDDADYATTLEQTRADVAAARATVEARKTALETQQYVIAAASASVDIDRANETFAAQNDKRYKKLAVDRIAPAQTAELASSSLAANQATTARDTASLQAARKQVVLLEAEVAQAEAALSHSLALQHQAEPVILESDRPDRRRRRQPHASHRPVCPGRNAIDDDRADAGFIHHRQLQGNATDGRQAGTIGFYRNGYVPGPGLPRPC